jgi:hypothetical protein
MRTQPTGLSRRHFLRGAGALLALPFMESMGRVSAFAASAAVRPPLRMGIFTVTGGTVIESWKVAQDGPFGSARLPSILRPLEFCKDDVLLLANLSQGGRSENLNAHEHAAFLHLTCANQVKRDAGKPVADVSVDQMVARHIGDQTFLPSLEIGLSNNETKYSFRSKTEPVPYEANPRLVFDRMFRGRKPVVPNWQRRAAALGESVQQSAGRDSYEQSVIDLVLEDARSLQKRLGRADQQKLDQYLHSVRTVEQRMQALEAKLRQEMLDAKDPGPAPLVHPEIYPENVNFGKVGQDIERDPEKHGEYTRIMADLMVLAFQTDTTRMCTLAIGSDGAMFPGVVTVGYERHCHTLEHQGNAGRIEDADPIAREACRQIHAWYTSLFAEMVKKMKELDEGGSSLLDNTMLLYTSYMADGGHGRNDYPALLVGNAQGSIKTGRQVSFENNTPVANLYIEMMDRMGVKTESFGDSQTSRNAAYNGRLPLA